MKENIRSTLVLFAFLFTITFQYGCNSDTLKEQNINIDNAETLQKETQIDSFNIVISTAGGFTGLGSGFTLTSNGIVRHWKQLSFVKDTILWEKDSELSKILQFKNELDTCGILQKNYSDAGNMTTSLNYNLQDTSYTWTWEEKGTDLNIPVEIKDWFKNVLTFCTEK